VDEWCAAAKEALRRLAGGEPSNEVPRPVTIMNLKTANLLGLDVPATRTAPTK
jgi:hypothetical protein